MGTSGGGARLRVRHHVSVLSSSILSFFFGIKIFIRIVAVQYYISYRYTIK